MTELVHTSVLLDDGFEYYVGHGGVDRIRAHDEGVAIHYKRDGAMRVALFYPWHRVQLVRSKEAGE